MLCDCIPWDGPLDRDGYGRMNEGKLAHRVIYESVFGPIPDGLEIDHLCRNRSCVNPAHMEPVTHAENAGRTKGLHLLSHCRHGHEFSPQNTWVGKNGQRQCRRCNVARQRLYQQRKKERSA